MSNVDGFMLRIAHLERREAELLKANNEYLARARNAEAKTNVLFRWAKRLLQKNGYHVIEPGFKQLTYIDNKGNWFIFAEKFKIINEKPSE